jgi:hypothetical protein
VEVQHQILSCILFCLTLSQFPFTEKLEGSRNYISRGLNQKLMYIFDYILVKSTLCKRKIFFGKVIGGEGDGEIEVMFKDLVSRVQHIPEMLAMFEFLFGIFVGDPQGFCFCFRTLTETAFSVGVDVLDPEAAKTLAYVTSNT